MLSATPLCPKQCIAMADSLRLVANDLRLRTVELVLDVLHGLNKHRDLRSEPLIRQPALIAFPPPGRPARRRTGVDLSLERLQQLGIDMLFRLLHAEKFQSPLRICIRLAPQAV